MGNYLIWTPFNLIIVFTQTVDKKNQLVIRPWPVIWSSLCEVFLTESCGHSAKKNVSLREPINRQEREGPRRLFANWVLWLLLSKLDWSHWRLLNGAMKRRGLESSPTLSDVCHFPIYTISATLFALNWFHCSHLFTTHAWQGSDDETKEICFTFQCQSIWDSLRRKHNSVSELFLSHLSPVKGQPPLYKSIVTRINPTSPCLFCWQVPSFLSHKSQLVSFSKQLEFINTASVMSSLIDTLKMSKGSWPTNLNDLFAFWMNNGQWSTCRIHCDRSLCVNQSAILPRRRGRTSVGVVLVRIISISNFLLAFTPEVPSCPPPPQPKQPQVSLITMQ